MNIALPAGVSIAIVLFFRLLNIYSPPPPGAWPAYLAYPVTYLTAILGAEAGSFWMPRRRSRQLIVFACAVVLFIALAFGYWFLASTPPTPAQRPWFTWGAYVAFVLSQFLFGFCTWKVVAFLKVVAFFMRQRK